MVLQGWGSQAGKWDDTNDFTLISFKRNSIHVRSSLYNGTIYVYNHKKLLSKSLFTPFLCAFRVLFCSLPALVCGCKARAVKLDDVDRRCSKRKSFHLCFSLCSSCQCWEVRHEVGFHFMWKGSVRKNLRSHVCPDQEEEEAQGLQRPLVEGMRLAHVSPAWKKCGVSLCQALGQRGT